MKEARPEVWAYGFRNPWRMSFDRQTGELFVGDVGWELWEMVHRVEKGGNYGWAAMEGPQPIKPEQVGPTPILPALIELPHTIACSVTGGYVYRGKKFPELRGAYIFGDWETRRLWAARFEGDRTKEMPEIARPSVRIVAFGEDHDGEMYFLDQDGGTLHTLERNDATRKNADFPDEAFRDRAVRFGQGPQAGGRRDPVRGEQPAVAGRRDCGALGGFPGRVSATLYATGKPIPGMVDWHNFRMHFPKDAVLMRTLSLEDGGWRRSSCTYDGVDWHAYTYAWRDDQSDADLVPADGAEKEVARWKPQTRVWQFHSRSQCMSCHSNQSEYALAFLPEQLNRPGPDGRNQLVAFTESGFIRRAGNDGNPLPPFDDCLRCTEPKIADPSDESPAARGTGSCLPSRKLRSLPLRPRRRVGSSAPAVPVPSRRDEGDRRPLQRVATLRCRMRAIIKPGDPVRQHPVLPYGQVRPRPDAAHRFRLAGRSRAEPHRAVDRRYE